MSEPTYTNTALATARRCLREYDLRYRQQLEPVDTDNEALEVGSCWHKAFDVQHKGGDPYDAITRHAPSPLWGEKLRRLFAAHAWHWETQPLTIVESERTFRADLGRATVFEGQLDGIALTDDGRRVLVERKTTSDDLGGESSYWDRLRLDVQVGIYALALGEKPSAILYDVVKKPTIRPKGITKKDASRMRAEAAAEGFGVYFGEKFTAADIEHAVEGGRETDGMYGARLTADIGDQPGKYFARREIPRTTADYEALLVNLDAQVELIQYAEAHGLLHRNPDQCHAFNRRCDFLGLCGVNRETRVGDPVPEGFQRREHRHPELAPDPEN